jgi:hypothetical protein
MYCGRVDTCDEIVKVTTFHGYYHICRYVDDGQEKMVVGCPRGTARVDADVLDFCCDKLRVAGLSARKACEVVIRDVTACKKGTPKHIELYEGTWDGVGEYGILRSYSAKNACLYTEGQCQYVVLPASDKQTNIVTPTVDYVFSGHICYADGIYHLWTTVVAHNADAIWPDTDVLLLDADSLAKPAGAANIICGGRMLPLEIAEIVDGFVPNPGIHVGSRMTVGICEHLYCHPNFKQYVRIYGAQQTDGCHCQYNVHVKRGIEADLW